MNKIFNKYITILKTPKFLIIAGIIGIFLIFISSFFAKDETEKNKKEIKADVFLTEYREALEEDICSIVSDITGSRRVEVMVTLESSLKYSYAEKSERNETEKQDSGNKSSDSSYKEEFITIKTDDGGEEALIVTEKMPEVRGVAIVCEGGDNEILNEKMP